MGSISTFLANELLDHVVNEAAYSPPATVYVALSLSFSIRSGSYQWTASGSGTSEYYLEASGGGNPNLGGNPGVVLENADGVSGTEMTAGTLGALAAGEWGYGDNDSLGYSTIYVRLSDSTDPDSKAAGYVQAGGNPFDDASGLSEPGAGSYARVSITLGAAASRRVTQSGTLNFAQATAAWGYVTHWAKMDASTGGNMMGFGQLNATQYIASGNTPSIASAEIYTEYSAGEISNYLANALLDFAFRNQSYTSPTGTYVALTTATIADTDTGSTITEPGTGSYARVRMYANSSGTPPYWNTASAGSLNNAFGAVNFPDATANLGTLVAGALLDDPTAGNLLFYDNGMTDQAVNNTNTYNIPTGSFIINMS